ncbi:MAG: MFS transporter [Gemmatimonadaceae bacterium]
MSQSANPRPVGDDAPYPPARYAWYVVGVLMLANVSGFVDRQILSLLVMPIRRDLGISDTQMSILMGLSFALFQTALGVPIGRLADSHSRRAIIAAGVGAWSVMTMACGLARTYTQLVLARIGVGVGEAALQAPAVSLVADYFPRARRATAMSVYTLGTFVGSGLAYLVGGTVAGAAAAPGRWHWPIVGELYPWQSVFFIVGAPGLLIACLFVTIREPVRRGRAALSSAGTPPIALSRYVLANAATFSTQSLGFAFSATVNYGIAAWLPTFLVRTYGWPIARAGIVQGVLTMTVGVLGVVTGGRVADRLVRRGTVDGPLRVGIVGALGMLLFAGLYPLMPTAALAVLLLAPVNFFAAFPWGAAYTAAAESMPSSLRAQGTAVYVLVINLVSGTLGATAVALVTDRVFRDDTALRYSLSIVSAAGMLLAAVLLAAGLGPYRRTVGALPFALHPPRSM